MDTFDTVKRNKLGQSITWTLHLPHAPLRWRRWIFVQKLSHSVKFKLRKHNVSAQGGKPKPHTPPSTPQRRVWIHRPHTWLKGEVIHHLQSAHHHKIWSETCKFCSKLLHGGQVGVMVIAVNDVSAEEASVRELRRTLEQKPTFKQVTKPVTGD